MRVTRFVMMAWIAAASAYGAQAQRKLTIYLKLGNDRNMIAPLAQSLAARMFANIGIALEWKSWKQAGERVEQPIVIEIASQTPPEFRPGVLGFAQPYEGCHITIFLDRIEGVECPWVLLAHVLVHEITHIVQGTSRHSDTGVMKAHWSGRDLCDMWHRPLPFAPVDLDLIHQGLSARQGAAATLEVAR